MATAMTARPHSAIVPPSSKIMIPSTPVHSSHAKPVPERNTDDVAMETRDKRRFRISTSTTSTASTESTESSARRFWAPSPPLSPDTTPETSPSPVFSNTLPSGLAGPPTRTRLGDPSTITYVPPFLDPAGRTTSRRQRKGATWVLLEDLPWLVATAQDLARLGVRKTVAPVVATADALWHHPLSLSVDGLADAVEGMLQAALGVVQILTVVSSPVVFLCVPGILFAAWLGLCLVSIRLLARPLNAGTAQTGQVFYPPWSNRSIAGNTDFDTDFDTDADETWLFVPGVGATSRSLAKTCPRIAGAFGRPVTLVRPRTCGALADFAIAVLRRVFGWSLGADDALYARALAHLSSGSRVVIVTHNTGASAATRAIARLALDIAPDQLARLQVYTFGCTEPDFALPRAQRFPRAPKAPKAPKTVHVEHMAHERDPCARHGILATIRSDVAARYGGGVFVLGSSTGDEAQGPTTPTARRQYRMSFPPAQQPIPTETMERTATALFSMEDYLAALFGPEPWSMRPTMFDPKDPSDAPFLNAAICIDHDVVDRRATANRHECAWQEQAEAYYRLSWTGVGATAKLTLPGDTDTSLSLIVDGQRGCDVSALAGYYADAVARHRATFFF